MKNKYKILVIIFLTAILIVAPLWIYIYFGNYYHKVVDNSTEDERRRDVFNSKFVAYEGKEKVASKVIDLLEKVKNNNTTDFTIKIELDGTEYDEIDTELVNMINQELTYTIYMKFDKDTGKVNKIYIWKES